MTETLLSEKFGKRWKLFVEGDLLKKKNAMGLIYRLKPTSEIVI